MKLTFIERSSLTYFASVGFAYLLIKFINYPTDWDGLCIELLDPEEDFTIFKEANFFYFRPSKAVAYNEDDEVILLDYNGQAIYGKDEYEEPISPDIEFIFKCQLDTKRTSLTSNKLSQKKLYFAAYRVIGGKKYIGIIQQETVAPGEDNFIELDIESYSLPVATDSVLGGVKVGTLLSITNEVLSADVQINSEYVDVNKYPVALYDGAGKRQIGILENNLCLLGASGAFHTDRIPSLAASKITSGSFTVARGGTGLSSLATGGILQISAANTLSRLSIGASGRFLRSSSTSNLAFVDMIESYIPVLPASKISSGVFDKARIPVISEDMMQEIYNFIMINRLLINEIWEQIATYDDVEERTEYIDISDDGGYRDVEYDSGENCLQLDAAGMAAGEGFAEFAVPLNVNDTKTAMLTWQIETPTNTSYRIDISYDKTTWETGIDQHKPFPKTIGAGTLSGASSLAVRINLYTSDSKITPHAYKLTVYITDTI